MIWKILIFALVMLVVWALLFRATGPKIPRMPKRSARPTRVANLIKCKDCGVYLPADKTCGCRDRA